MRAMFKGLTRSILPRGLYGRWALILIVPIVAIQLVVSVTFIQRHFERVTRQLTESVVREAAFLRARANAAPDAAAAQAAAAALARPLAIAVELPAPPATGDRRAWIDLSGRAVIETLREGLPQVQGVDLMADSGRVTVTLGALHGPMALTLDRRRVSATNPHQLLVLMIATGLLMTLIAVFFLRNQVRPITELARAAEAFGRGQHLPYRVRGAREVRAAGRAILDMRARIERQIEQRTLMLSGVSHDLRTPLTRLRLELSMLDQGPEVAMMLRDLREMEQMLDGFLDFARGGLAEEPVETDPADLVDGVIENALRAGQPVTCAACARDGGAVMLRRQAMTRALENLIGNAVRYGTRAEVRLQRDRKALRFIVEDDGPGIPEDRREDALRPFLRLDVARNQNTGGGVGLGLAITADVARAHGGQLRLGASEALGGLRAEIQLPL
jgi:two-component system osmolarity sensor histidine kinase EnvZ